MAAWCSSTIRARGSRASTRAGRVALGSSEAREHRSTFSGLRKWRPWSALDALYFFGYALTHYHALPWSLRDAEPLGLRRSSQAGATDALTVRFPPTLHTHSAVQTIHFAADGLIVRHDYVAEIISTWAHGAHLWSDYVEVDGFPIATHRRVLTRIGRQPLPLVALEARLGTPENRRARERRLEPPCLPALDPELGVRRGSAPACVAPCVVVRGDLRSQGRAQTGSGSPLVQARHP